MSVGMQGYGHTEGRVTERKVQWDRGAQLQRRAKEGLWVGEVIFDGTVGGAARHYAALAPDEQDRCDMFIDLDVVEGLGGIISGDDLRALAGRADVPKE
jgi:hypothetical protein